MPKSNGAVKQQQGKAESQKGFRRDHYDEFVGLFEDPEKGHQALMGIGQQMQTNTQLARRLGMRVDKSASGPESGGLESGGLELDVEESDGQEQDGQEHDGDSGDDDQPGRQGSGQRNGKRKKNRVSAIREKGSSLVADLFGTQKNSGDSVEADDEYGDDEYDEYGDDEYDDDGYDDGYEDDDLTLDSGDLGDGFQDHYEMDDLDADPEGVSESIGMKEFVGLASREAAKAAGGAVTRELDARFDKVVRVLEDFSDRLERIEESTAKQARSSAKEIDSFKEAVDGLAEQYGLLEEKMPPMANIRKLRSSQKDDTLVEEYDDEYDEYENHSDDGRHLDPLVEETFGFSDSW